MAATLSDGVWKSAPLPTPSTVIVGRMVGVDCAAADACAAVGQAYTLQGLVDGSYLEVLTPSGWKATAPPLPHDAQSATIESVSCPSAGSCVAVGSYVNPSGVRRPVVETLAGGSWTASVPPADSDTDAGLSGIDCPAIGSCVAVGSLGSGAALVETLTDATWTPSTPTEPDGTLGLDLVSVSCPDVAHCVATGPLSGQAPGYVPAVATLAEGVWSSTAIPGPAGGFVASADLTISCPSAIDCVVVGGGEFGAFASTLADDAWSTASLPSVQPGADPSSGAVTCPSVDACVMVGSANLASRSGAITETFDGTAWTGAPVDVNGPPDALLRTLSCATSSTCVAAGTFQDAQESSQVFVERLSAGSWAAQTLPSPDPDADPVGITCPSNNWCLALFTGDDGLFTDVYAGGAWTPARLPLDVGRVDSVSTPSCPAVGQCRIVTSYSTPMGAAQYVATSLSGGKWTTLSLSRPNGAWDQVFDLTLSCPTVDWCASTGTFNDDRNGGMLAQIFDNGTWTITTLPTPSGAAGPTLSGLSCPTAGACTAVGRNANDVSDDWQPIVETLQSGAWHGIQLPLPADSWNASLAGVSCLSANACLAVGTHLNQDRSAQLPLLERLVGTTWTPTVVANPAGSGDASLGAVSCIAGASCWAVGDAGASDGGSHPIAVQQASPTYVPPPHPSALSISASRRIDYGTRITVSTRLTDRATHAAIARAPVTLWWRATTSKTWQRLTSRTTSTSGSASVAVTPTVSRVFQWRFTGASGHTAVSSAVETAAVVQTIAAHRSRKSIKRRKTVRIYGTVRPVGTGQRVYLQRRSGKRWITVGSAVLKRQALSGKHKAVGFVFSRKPTKKGTLSFRVYRPATHSLAGRYSSTVTVRVR